MTQFRVSLVPDSRNCFGTCKGGGNVLDFVARKEGVGLRDAALLLCEWFDLPLVAECRSSRFLETVEFSHFAASFRYG